MRNHSSILAAHAHRMRQAPTDSEAALWRALRARQLGVEFRRQVPVLRFIVDFLAPRERLVVEIDGGYHEQRVLGDARRDQKLRRAGYRVLRIPSKLVTQNLPEVLAAIRASLE
jgi:very-short-patch-repair endonuclease